MKYELKPRDCHFRSRVNQDQCSPNQLADLGTVTAEKAYRRGVGQTLSMLEYYAEQLNLDKAILAKLEEQSRRMRYDCKAHDFYLHELIEPFVHQEGV